MLFSYSVGSRSGVAHIRMFIRSVGWVFIATLILGVTHIGLFFGRKEGWMD
jgi:hypothetical protein